MAEVGCCSGSGGWDKRRDWKRRFGRDAGRREEEGFDLVDRVSVTVLFVFAVVVRGRVRRGCEFSSSGNVVGIGLSGWACT